MGDDRASVASVLRIGLLLTLVVLAIGSLKFARYDWSGLPLDRTPGTAVEVVDAGCTERVHPYVTESGRVVGPIVVDEQQYLNLVELYRGVPRSDLQLACLYDPFTFRSGTSWIAHFLPFEEGLALGVTNTFMTVLGVWSILFALRAQGFSSRVVLAVGVLVAASWNVLSFGTGLMVDPSVVAAVALCWLLLAMRRPWFVWPVLLLSYPLKETIGIVVPVLFVWAWREHRDRGEGIASAFAPAVAGAVAFVVGVAVWRQLLPAPDAAWPVTPDVSDLAHNLTDVVGLGAFALGVAPFLVLSVLSYRREALRSGWVAAAVDPAVAGVLLALGVSVVSAVTADLTARHFWTGVPFAATLSARWFSGGRPREWLEGLRRGGAVIPRRCR